MIADGDHMGIPAQVFDHALGVSEGAFGKYHPLFFEQPVDQVFVQSGLAIFDWREHDEQI